jgi:hypothetical protein
MEPPVALRPEEISDDLICSVCLELPLDPVLTKKCQHLFCRSCITEALGVNQCDKCPIDRTSCRVSQLVPLEGITKRIWGSIKVKCSKHREGCAWTGSLGDYEAHVECCPSSLRSNQTSAEVKNLKRKLRSLQQTNERLEACLRFQTTTLVQRAREKDELQDTVRSLQQTNGRLEACLRSQATALAVRIDEKYELEDKVFILQTHKSELQRTVNQMQREHADLVQKLQSSSDKNNVVFDGNYFFDQQNVVPLCRLIFSHLDNKPSTIDSNIIYTCINKIVVELKNGPPETLPPNYHRHVQMLLSTCLATKTVFFQTWFTPMQMMNIECWYKELFEGNIAAAAAAAGGGGGSGGGPKF